MSLGRIVMEIEAYEVASWFSSNKTESDWTWAERALEKILELADRASGIKDSTGAWSVEK